MRPRWTLVFSRMCSPPRTPSKISRVWRTARSKLRSAPARASFACSRIGAPCGRRRASSASRALEQLAGQAALHGRTIGLENEHACNIATGAETARVLEAVAHPNLKVVWDPANAYVSGETPYPDGYRRLPVERIGHVYAKDCRVEGPPSHVVCAGRRRHRLERPDPRAGGGWLQRLDQPGDALDGAGRRQARGERYLRAEFDGLGDGQ